MSELINIIICCSIPVLAVDAFFLAILVSIMICTYSERRKNNAIHKHKRKRRSANILSQN